MALPINFRSALAEALEAPDPLTGLRSLAGRELAKGARRETLTEWFEEARELYPEREDLLLDALDFVTGWCSPHMKLNTPARDP